MMPVPTPPTVSVLIASYDSQAFITCAIRSILAQTLANLEIVVVDDASRDDSAALVARLAAADPRVRLIRLMTNAGPAAARNRAVAEARGDWVAIVDSDDLIAPTRLAELVAAATATHADMIADDLLVFDDGRPHAAVRFLADADRRAGTINLDLGTYLRRSVLYGVEPNPGFLKPLIRRDRLLASGVRYDERLRIAEDDDLVIRLLLAGLRYSLLARPGYFYRKHGGSISHRLTPTALEAMVAADRALAERIVAARPDLAGAVRARSRSYRRALALERAIRAIKAGRPDRALIEGLRQPGMLPLLSMPLGGFWRRLSPRPRQAEPLSILGDELAALLAQRDLLIRS